MKIKAKLGLSRAGMGSDSRMLMQIEDDTSGVLFAELEIPMEAFAFLVTGMYGIKADCELRGLENVGRIRESKAELVPVTSALEQWDARKDADLIAAALAPFEVNGWKGNESDLFNQNKRVHKDDGTLRRPFQSVHFHRFIDAPEGEDNAQD
jgi:hypothetical protein